MSSGSPPAPSSGDNASAAAVPDVRWSLILPFKGGHNAKSRLNGDSWPVTIDPDLRHELALGFLRDTVTAAAAATSVERIIIVSSDPAAALDTPKIQMLPDPGHGLNAAITAGFAFARSLNSRNPVAAVTADLPCLATPDLEDALGYAKHHPLAVVPDRYGTGTTMLTAQPGVPVRPLFGHHSLNAHLLAGHTLLPVPRRSTLRADVDTVEDLAAATEKGVGDYTRTALSASGHLRTLLPPAGDSPLAFPFERPTMQRKSCPAF